MIKKGVILIFLYQNVLGNIIQIISAVYHLYSLDPLSLRETLLNF